MFDPLLRTELLVSGYGKKQVLNGVNIEIGRSEIVALIGHNGAGKSTLLKAIFGLLPIWGGQVSLDRNNVTNFSPREFLQAGVAYIPQGNRVFADLTVWENLQVGGATLSDRERINEGIDHALSQFPKLKTRLRQRAGTLSGGEKQMLALANALILSPRLLLLDEPSLGLAPPLMMDAMQRIQELNRDSGTSVLVVEQKVRQVLNICHRVYSLKLGSVTFSGPPQELRTDEKKLRQVFL